MVAIVNAYHGPLATAAVTVCKWQHISRGARAPEEAMVMAETDRDRFLVSFSAVPLRNPQPAC